jgi:hypothetical protein
MKSILNSFLLCFCSVMALQNTFAQAPKGYTLLFEENFVGSKLNEDMWQYRTGRRTGFGYMDGLNLKENVYVKDSALHVVLKHELIDGKWENTGGGVISKLDFGYGYYECLSKPFMDGHGVHTSYWQRGSSTPNNNIFEIDAYEIDSKTWVATNNLYLDLAPNKSLKYTPWPHRAQVPFTLDKDGWFLDAYEFTPEGIIFYDNGTVVAKCDWHELNARQAIWLTALNGVGKVDSTKLPAESVFKYFKYYGKDYPGITILPNGNFEYNFNKVDFAKPMCWTPKGTEGSIKIVAGAAFRDEHKLKIGHGKAHKSSLSQSLTYIMNGEYDLTARVRSSGGQKEAKLTASGFGGSEMSVNIPKSDKWTEIKLSKIKVTNNKVTIQVSAEGAANQWLEIDDINFMKPLPKGQKLPESVPFFKKNAPVWQLAIKEPIVFTGNQKFYFFDRMVGFGDSITVAFDLKADAQANMTPITRIPKKGESGWSIQLQADGSLLFRIGSIENHKDVIAPNAYEVGKVASFKCVFEKGTASIFKNGKLLKTESGIKQNTKDATAAGRVGTVGQDFEAVGDVVMEVGKADKESTKMKNFRGAIQNLKIYNEVK